MSNEELATSLIAQYAGLLRIKAAENKGIEVNKQINMKKAQLKALGDMVDGLIIERG